MLTQNHKFYAGSQFIDDFVSYYKMTGYIMPDTYVEYESPYIRFSYNKGNFMYRMKRLYWQYKRPKITYVPTERNIVSMYPNFETLPNTGNHIQDFMIDWKTARTNKASANDILGMGFDYRYDEATNRDYVTTPDSTTLELTNTSSGIQSMMPLYIHLDYILNTLYDVPECNLNDLTIDKKQEVMQLLDFLYERIGVPVNAKKNLLSAVKVNNQALKFWFSRDNDQKKFEDYVKKLLYYNHTEIFLEEPENNLFPPTQVRLLDWILDNTIYGRRNDTLFIATHSPYVLTKLLEKGTEGVRFLFTYKKTEGTSVRMVSKKDVGDILDYGVDMFYNYETFV